MTPPARLHLVSFAAELPKLIAFAAARGTIPPSGDLGYAFHQALQETFGPAAPKPFHFFGNGGGRLAAYSPHDAARLREFAAGQHGCVPGFALASQALGLSSMEAYALPESWASGSLHRFSVRTRPVCRISRHRERGLPRECDVFLRAAASKPEGSEWIGREDVYTAWFREQVPKEAAALISLQLTRLGRTQVYRKGAPRLGGPDVTFSGVLEIADADAFQSWLTRGAGRHRAFGFGMILLAQA